MSEFGDSVGLSVKHTSYGGSEVCVPWWNICMGFGFGGCKRAFEINGIGLCENVVVVIFWIGFCEIEDLFQFGVVSVSPEVLN